jgi:mRNA interferase HigB
LRSLRSLRENISGYYPPFHNQFIEQIVMHIISQKRLKEFWVKYPNSQSSLEIWYNRTKVAQWNNFEELRQIFPSADQVKNLIVFNIGGNKYRLIALVDFTYKKVFIRQILTHAEYDKNDWKKDQWFGNK